jgi:hypothetical protein
MQRRARSNRTKVGMLAQTPLSAARALIQSAS